MPGHDTLINVSVVCSWVGTDHRASYLQIRFEELPPQNGFVGPADYGLCPTDKMPENQQHGFLWESEIKTKAFGLTGPDPYTAVHDVDRSRNTLNPNENVSIKTTGSDTLCMGDALRVFAYETGVEHTCIAVRYDQRDVEKHLKQVYELDLMQRELLWGRVTKEDIESLDTLVRSMPAGGRVADIDRAIKEKKKELNSKSGAVRFNPKIDSKNQRRLQCSIPKFPSYPALIKSVTAEPLVRGVAIAASILTGRRVRNRRV